MTRCRSYTDIKNAISNISDFYCGKHSMGGQHQRHLYIVTRCSGSPVMIAAYREQTHIAFPTATPLRVFVNTNSDDCGKCQWQNRFIQQLCWRRFRGEPAHIVTTHSLALSHLIRDVVGRSKPINEAVATCEETIRQHIYDQWLYYRTRRFKQRAEKVAAAAYRKDVYEQFNADEVGNVFWRAS